MGLRPRGSQQKHGNENDSSHSWYWLRKVANGTENKHRGIYLPGQIKWPDSIFCLVCEKSQWFGPDHSRAIGGSFQACLRHTQVYHQVHCCFLLCR